MQNWHVGIYRKKVLNIHLDKLLILVYVTTVIWQLVITVPHVWGAN